MKSKWLFVIVLIAAGTIEITAQASIWSTGNDLLTNCGHNVRYMDRDATANSLRMGFCQGFLSAMVDMSQFAADSARSCPPSGVTVGQLSRVVVAYLNEHPADLHLRDTVLVLRTMRDAFPCP